MTMHRFDAFVRRLPANIGRRNALALLFGAIAASVAAPRTALACKKVGKKCDKNKDCCDGAKCKGGKCKCKAGFAKCDERCYKLESDERHCGACGIACAPGEQCCTFFEPGGSTAQCYDLLTHTTACGLTCDTVVNCFNTGQICVNGVCVDP
jgi:hypothetical protein